MEQTYTLALASRLRRKIFSDEPVRAFFILQMFNALIGEGVVVVDTRFREDGVILTVRGENLDPDYIVAILRYRTSGTVRERFSKFSKMPSLWTKKCLCLNGELSNIPEEEIIEFFNSIKTR